jgi:hypothetical protein
LHKVSIAPLRKKSMKTVRERLAIAFLLATMARKKTPQPSNHQPPDASTEMTGSSPWQQHQHTMLQLLLATEAGQERSRGTPCSSAKKPHLASTAGQGNFNSAAEVERRTCRRRFVVENGAAPCHLSLRPPK